MTDSAAAIDALWADCPASNRRVPMPPQRNQLYGLLKNARQKPFGGREPPLPLILAARHHTKPIEKQLRFKEHLERAQQDNPPDQFSAFLRALAEDPCYHFGEA